MKVFFSKYNLNRIDKHPNLDTFTMYMLNRFTKDDQYYITGYYTLSNANVKNLTRFANSLNKLKLRNLSLTVRRQLPPPEKRSSPKNVKKNITTATAAKKVLHRALALRAGKAYTHVWNGVISETNNIKPKTNKLPPGFIGTVNQKYNRAKLYKQRIIQWMYSHPKKYNRPLYRGVTGAEAKMFMSSDFVVKKNLTSFSKKFEIAVGFASRENPKTRPLIIKINPTSSKLPSIDYTEKLFTTKFKFEHEVLLPPGVFEVIQRPKTKVLFENKYGNFKPFDMITVKFKP